jgi:dipeptidyl-peptidase 4
LDLSREGWFSLSAAATAATDFIKDNQRQGQQSSFINRMPLSQSDYRAKVSSHSTIQSSDVAKLPKPGTGSVPSCLKIKGDWITYLAPEDPTSLTRQLYATSLSSNTTVPLFQPGNEGQETDFSLEEKLRRERARMHSTGVTSYAWANKVPVMLVPLGGALYVLRDPLNDSTSATSTATKPYKLVETGTNGLPLAAPLLDAKLSADGSTVAFVADQEVYVVSTTTSNGTPIQVTSGARGIQGLSHGVADYLAQEELERADGFWLSPRGTKLAFEQVDESHIPLYRITHQGQENGLSPSLKHGMTCQQIANNAKVSYEEHRYPFAGKKLPLPTFILLCALSHSHN